MLLQNSTFNHIFQGRNLNFVLNYVFFCLNILVASVCKGLCLRMSFHARWQCCACSDQLFLLYTAYFRIGVRMSCCCDNKEVQFVRMFSEEDRLKRGSKSEWLWRKELERCYCLLKYIWLSQANFWSLLLIWICEMEEEGKFQWYTLQQTSGVSGMYPASECLFFFSP